MGNLETEHGIFTNNETTGQTAQEVYDEWLKNKDKEPIIEISLQEKKQTALAIKLLAPTLSDEDLTQVPLLIDEWVAEVEYVADKSVVRYEDVLYRVITSHRSQSDWPPSGVPALYKIIEAPGVIGPWRQPLGEHDAYQTGDKVTHKDKTWESTADNNVWEPGVYGWV